MSSWIWRVHLMNVVFAVICAAQTGSINGVTNQNILGGSTAPAGSAGCVQLYGTSTAFACDATANVNTTTHMVTFGNATDSDVPDHGVFEVANTFTGPIAGNYAVGSSLYSTWGGFTMADASTTIEATEIGHVFNVNSSVDALYGNYWYVYPVLSNGSTVNLFEGSTFNVSASGTGTISDLRLTSWRISGEAGVAVANASSSYYEAPDPTTTGFVNWRVIMVEDQAGTATNPYYSWFDSTGVRRVKEDSTFNSVGQAIEALYNPQFTKYTPGAANYERIVLGEWNSNVSEIGNQAGGTGTLREVRVIGQDMQIPILAFAGLATPANSAEVYCSDCTVTSSINDTCAGSGMGAWAQRINGAWSCRQ